MADNEFDKKPEEELPEDFRPIVPEPEIHRRAIIGFYKNYPVQENPTSTHTESFAQQEFKRKVRNGILYGVALVSVFIFTFIITDTCIKISKAPIPPTTAVVTQAPPPATTQTTEETTEEESTQETVEETTSKPQSQQRTERQTEETVTDSTVAPTTEETSSQEAVEETPTENPTQETVEEVTE